MADKVFDGCVAMLLDLAAVTGTTYREINVIIFCVLWPAATLWLILLVLRMRRKIEVLENGLKATAAR